MSPYHYIQCGLDNVWLRNGVEIIDTPYGKGVSIQNVEGLHEAIAEALTEKTDRLTGNEFRFLRTQLEMSQKRLGEMFGKDSQAIAAWEKKREVGKQPDFLIRHIYKQHRGERQTYVELVEGLNELDKAEYYSMNFEESGEHWTKAV